MIITWSLRRAKKDKTDRQRLINKATKLVDDPGKIDAGLKRGSLKYLKRDADKAVGTNWVLDQEGINQDVQFDGYYGIQTSEQNMDTGKIINAYHTLWKIEDSFQTRDLLLDNQRCKKVLFN